MALLGDGLWEEELQLSSVPVWRSAYSDTENKYTNIVCGPVQIRESDCSYGVVILGG